MNWRFYIMAGVVAALIGVLGTVIFGIYNDKKGYRKIDEKIGDTNKGALSNQHERITEVIQDAHKDTAGIVNRVFDKVTSIDKYLAVEAKEQENQHLNLNEKQKEIEAHVVGIEELVRDWRSVIAENKELKHENDRLNQKNRELQIDNKKLRDKYLHHDNDFDISL